MAFGRPLMAGVKWNSTYLPQVIDDNLLSESPHDSANQPAYLPSLLECYIEHIKLYDILDQALHREDKNGLQDSSSMNKDDTTSVTSTLRNVLDLDTMLIKWQESLPSYLRFDPDTTDHSQEDTEEAAVSPDGLLIPNKDLRVQAKRLYLR